MALRQLSMVLFAGAVLACVQLAGNEVAPRVTLASDRGETMEAAAGVDAPAPDSLQAADGSDDHRLAVQLWTVFAAGGAAGLGLVLFLVRIALGRAKPPPPADDVHH